MGADDSYMSVLSRINRLAPRWIRRLPALASVASLLAVVLMALAAVAIGSFSLNSAEQDRLNERGRLVQRMGEHISSTYDPDVLQTTVDQTALEGNRPELTIRMLAQFVTGPSGDPAALVALVRDDGTLVVSSPAGITPPTTQLGAAWRDAVTGTPGRSASFQYRGQPSWAMLASVGSRKRSGVLIVIENSTSTSAQTFARQLGTIGGAGGGGLSALDTGGRALVSWNPDLLGARLVEPGILARLPVGRIVTTTVGTGAGQVTTILVGNRDGTATIFRQSTSTLFADLQVQQQRRDLTLIAVLAMAVGGLVLASLLRVRAVRRNRARLHTLLSNTEDLIVVVSSDTTLTFVSPTLHTLLGFDAEAWMDHPLTTYTHPDDVERLTQLVNNPDGVRTVLDLRLREHHGEYRWFDIEAGDVSDDPELRGVLLTCHSVGERKALQDKLIRQARHDVLTGLPNRLMLTGQLTTALSTNPPIAPLTHPALSSPPPRPALLFIDLDRFKHVNDRYGHEAGDQVLHAVAERLNALVREGDLVCRFGGDEFGIVLQAATPTGAQHIADRIVSALSRPITIATTERTTSPPSSATTDAATGPAVDPSTRRVSDAVTTRDPATTTVQIGASVGIAIAAPGLDHPETLLRAADGAMYRAKELGRGQSVMWRQDTGDDPQIASAVAVAPIMAPGGVQEFDLDSDPVRFDPSGPIETALGMAFKALGPAVGAERGGWRRRARSMGRSIGSVAVVSLAIVAVAGLGVWQSAQARQVDERERMAERLALTARVAEYTASTSNLQPLIKLVSAPPWALDGGFVDEVLVRAVLNPDLGGSNAQAELRTTGGKILATASNISRAGITPKRVEWRSALKGEVGYRPLDVIDGKLSESYAIPLMRQGRVAAVLLVDQELKTSVAEKLLESLGSLGFGDGGVSSVALDGRVTHSWNPALIGQQILPTMAIRNLPADRAVRIAAAQGSVTLAARVITPRAAHAKIIAFQQPTAVFYGDLRSGQRPRDIALFAVVAVAIGLLGAARWQQEQALHRSEKHLDALLRNAHDIVVVVAHSYATFISSAITGLLGHDPAGWLNQPLADLVHPEDRRRLDRYTRTVGSVPAVALHDVRLLVDDGTYRWFDLHATDLTDRPEVAGILFTCHEVGERKALQDELAYRARHDALTGLPNRAVFNHHLDAIKDTPEAEALGYTVLFIDLDRFKPVNDTFGHDAGDDVLRSVAHRLATSASHTHDSLICRLGGDEFAILLPGTDPSTATHLANDILQRVRQPITIRGTTGQAVQIGATIGIAYAQPADNPATIVKRADQAMYQAKDSGRGRYVVHAG